MYCGERVTQYHKGFMASVYIIGKVKYDGSSSLFFPSFYNRHFIGILDCCK